MTEQTKKRCPQSEGVEQKTRVLTVQVLWGCEAHNASPEEAARRVVADLLQHLLAGGGVAVHIEEADGTEYMLDVSAG